MGIEPIGRRRDQEKCGSVFMKFGAAMVMTGALAVGSVGAAAAAPSGGSSGGPSAPAPAVGQGHPKCSRAPRALARVQKVEGRIAARLAKLEGWEQWAQANAHPRLVARIQARITRLDARQARGHALAGAIEARCPASGTGPSPSGTGSTGSSASTTAGAQGGQGGTT